MSFIRIITDNHSEVHAVYFAGPREDYDSYPERFLKLVDNCILNATKYKIEYLSYTIWSKRKSGVSEDPCGWDWLWYSPKLSKKTLQSMIDGGGSIWRPEYYGQNLARISAQGFSEDNFIP